jgi:hypothetical protein
VISPLAGRLATVAAALVTIRLAAAWSYAFHSVFAVCLVATVAAVAAILAPRLPSTVDGRDYGSDPVAASVMYKTTHYQGMSVAGPYRDYFSSIEHNPLFLAVPALAVGLVIAASLADRMPARAGATVVVALGGLLWLAAPIRNLAIVAGGGLHRDRSDVELDTAVPSR